MPRAWCNPDTWPPLDPEYSGPYNPKISITVLVKTDYGEQYTATKQDWSFPQDGDEPNPKWVMKGPDGYDIERVTGWMPLPPL